MNALARTLSSSLIRFIRKDESISIGLVVNAADDSLIEDWTLKSKPFRDSRRRAKKQALQSGNLRGGLWHHDRTHRICPLDDMKDLVAEYGARKRDNLCPVLVAAFSDFHHQ